MPGYDRLAAKAAIHDLQAIRTLLAMPGYTDKEKWFPRNSLGQFNCHYFVFLRRAIPTSPSRPEPKSHTEGGIGTADETVP